MPLSRVMIHSPAFKCSTGQSPSRVTTVVPVASPQTLAGFTALHSLKSYVISICMASPALVIKSLSHFFDLKYGNKKFMARH